MCAGPPVLRLDEVSSAAVEELLGACGLTLELVPAAAPIPGSYWGESEAGLVGARLYARPDTPMHSLLHEASHYVCMTPARRTGLDRDAGGDDAEECGVCYLQVLLADALPGVGRERLYADMDAWGYSFRLGASRAWFERDADDARAWLVGHGILDAGGRFTGRARG